MKTFHTPKAEILCMSIEDILTNSLGDDGWLDEDDGWVGDNCFLGG